MIAGAITDEESSTWEDVGMCRACRTSGAATTAAESQLGVFH